MGLDADVRTELIAASTTLGQRVHQNKVPQQQANLFPRCWFAKNTIIETPDLDGTRGTLRQTDYDVEMISSDDDQADAAAAAVWSAMNGKRGTFGSGTIKGCFIEDQSDDYVPRGVGSDDGLFVSALRITIYST